VLGHFYAKLLDWTVVEEEADWVAIEAPPGRYGEERHGMAFQREKHWVRPVWPAVPGQQQMTMHLDIAVDDLQAGLSWALELGATHAAFQPQEQNLVLLDPAGNPFCLGQDER
jgi:catechol 2,3-dioxygenase-like lactoylglutathione lyase family enzyme